MKTIRLLTIGNSFAENALTYLADIAASSGKVHLEVGRANLGGCSLEKHWNLAVYTAQPSAFKTYQIGKSADGSPYMATLQEALAAQPWDYITLQQVSWRSPRRESFQPHLDHLCGLVHRLAPQAQRLLHQTWAYRSDSTYLPENGLTQDLMFERIRESYLHYSAALNCRVIPAGAAVQRARQAAGRAFVWPDPAFDYQHARAPELPDQTHSLAVGWHWAITNTPEGIPELRNDPNHLNVAGCYLIGCVWFECLTGLSIHETTFTPAGMDRDTVAFFRTVAHDTVATPASYERFTPSTGR